MPFDHFSRYYIPIVILILNRVKGKNDGGWLC
jgi:hypothetical protein